MWVTRLRHRHAVKTWLLCKIFFPALFSLLLITHSAAATPKLLISGYMANPNSTDAQYEYIQLFALENIDFSATPHAVVFTNNGTAKSSGWVAGAGLTYGFNLNSGTIQAGEFAYVGGAGKLINGVGSTDISSAKWLRAIDNGNNAGDGFGNKNSSGVLGNGGSNADGFAVFDMDISLINSSTIPIDAVFFGSAIGSAKPASGGYTVPSNDHYDSAQGTFGNGSNTYLFPIPKIGYFVKLFGNYHPASATWTNPRTITEYDLSSSSTLSELNPSLQVDFAPTLSSTSPNDAATHVSGNITLTFSEAVDLTANAVTVLCPDAISFTGLPASNVSSITLIPTTTYPSAANCTVTIFADQVHDKNGAANPMQANVSFSFTTATLNTTPSVLPQNITAFNLPNNATYGDNDIPLTATGGGSNNPVIFASSTPETCSVTGTNLKILAAGACNITVNQAGNAHYEAAPELSKTLSISKKIINAKIDNKNRTYGAVNPVFTISYTELIDGNIEKSPTLNSAANLSSPVGNYPIVCDNSGSSSKNYVIETCENAVLTVEKFNPVINLSQTASYVIFGNKLLVKFSITGSPTGEITVSDGVSSCSASVALGSCQLNPSSSGVKILTATYAGDNNHFAASQTQTLKVAQVLFSRDNLTLTEGASDSYSVKLATQPYESIQLSIVQSAQITTNPTTLLFTPNNWNVAQTVKLVAVDDVQIQGNRALNLEHKIITGDSAGYPENLTLPSIKIAILDNDVATTVYVAPSYTLILQTTGTGKGSLTGTPAGVYSQASMINLTATPDNNSEFKGWSPQNCATAFNLFSDTICTARFDLKPVAVSTKPIIPQIVYYQLTTQTSGTGSGVIAGTAAGKYISGSNIQLTATPEINSVFTGWSPASCAQIFSLNADQICTAQFDLKPLPVPTKTPPVIEKQIISTSVTKPEVIAPIVQNNNSIGKINADNNPCFLSRLLNTVCYGAQVKTSITEISTNGQLSNAIIDAPLLNQGWISDSRVTARGEVMGGMVTGYIENQGVIHDIEFKGRYIKGGVLAGKIINSSVEGYLENVTFAADSSLNGGVLQGIIRGNPNAPALLENVILKKDSMVSGVRFGKNVVLEAGVTLLEMPYLPVLEKLSGIDSTGKAKTTRSRFYGGISVSGKAYVQKATQLLAEPVSIRGRIIPEPEHIGQKVDLFVYSPYFEVLPNLGENRPHYLADTQGKILLWNQKPENLIAFKAGVILESVHELEMFVGHFIATGGLNIVFGYRLEDGSLFMTDVQNGIEVTIQ